MTAWDALGLSMGPQLWACFGILALASSFIQSSKFHNVVYTWWVILVWDFKGY